MVSKKRWATFLKAFKSAGGWDGPATAKTLRANAEYLMLEIGMTANAAGNLLARIQQRDEVAIKSVMPTYHSVRTVLRINERGDNYFEVETGGF